MLQTLGLLSGLISVICYFPYVRDILRKTTKPERASWLIWTVLGSIAFFSQLAEGASNSLWMVAIQTVLCGLVFILSLHHGEGGLLKRDIVALLIAALGLLVWFFTKEAAYALFIVIAVDAAGASLTILKSYKDPGSETMSTWFLSGLSGFVSMLAVGSLNWVLLSYPIYIWLVNWVVVAAMLLGSKRIKLSHV